MDVFPPLTGPHTTILRGLLLLLVVVIFPFNEANSRWFILPPLLVRAGYDEPSSLEESETKKPRKRIYTVSSHAWFYIEDERFLHRIDRLKK